MRLGDGELVPIGLGDGDVRVEPQMPAAYPSSEAKDAADHHAKGNGFNAPQALQVVTREERFVRHADDSVGVEKAWLLACEKVETFLVSKLNLHRDVI